MILNQSLLWEAQSFRSENARHGPQFLSYSTEHYGYWGQVWPSALTQKLTWTSLQNGFWCCPLLSAPGRTGNAMGKGCSPEPYPWFQPGQHQCAEEGKEGRWWLGGEGRRNLIKMFFTSNLHEKDYFEHGSRQARPRTWSVMLKYKLEKGAVEQGWGGSTPDWNPT